jgi:hypothetical protein
LATLVIGASRCVVITRDGAVYEIAIEGNPREPAQRGPSLPALALASLAYARLCHGLPAEGAFVVRLGENRHTVVVRTPR